MKPLLPNFPLVNLLWLNLLVALVSLSVLAPPADARTLDESYPKVARSSHPSESKPAHVLGFFAIPLRRDPAERTNILLAARAVDGTTIVPGGVFSFNHVVGARSRERGYQDGWMFSQGRLTRGVGGGVCLVATAIYNAALQAGFLTVERHRHSGHVTYCPNGLDAAVVYGVLDLRMENRRAESIVIVSQVLGHRIVISLFDRTVERAEEPLGPAPGTTGASS